MKKILLVALALVIAATVMGCGAKERNWTTTEYYVYPGDTLWSIAASYCPEDMDIREYIYEVKEYNNMTTSGLRAGQTIDILVEKGDA